jgi:hypothetical protein
VNLDGVVCTVLARFKLNNDFCMGSHPYAKKADRLLTMDPIYSLFHIYLSYRFPCTPVTYSSLDDTVGGTRSIRFWIDHGVVPLFILKFLLCRRWFQFLRHLYLPKADRSTTMGLIKKGPRHPLQMTLGLNIFLFYQLWGSASTDQTSTVEEPLHFQNRCP